VLLCANLGLFSSSFAQIDTTKSKEVLVPRTIIGKCLETKEENIILGQRLLNKDVEIKLDSTTIAEQHTQIASFKRSEESWGKSEKALKEKVETKNEEIGVLKDEKKTLWKYIIGEGGVIMLLLILLI